MSAKTVIIGISRWLLRGFTEMGAAFLVLWGGLYVYVRILEHEFPTDVWFWGCWIAIYLVMDFSVSCIIVSVGLRKRMANSQLNTRVKDQQVEKSMPGPVIWIFWVSVLLVLGGAVGFIEGQGISATNLVALAVMFLGWYGIYLATDLACLLDQRPRCSHPTFRIGSSR